MRALALPPAVLLAVLVLMTPSPSSQPRVGAASAVEILRRGVDAIGGADAVRGVRSLRLEYTRELANSGQEEWPGAPTPWFRPADVHEVMDLSRDAVWTNLAFARATGPSSIWAIAGDRGVFRTDTGIVGGTSTVWSGPAKRRMRLEPVFLLQRALDATPSAFRVLKPRRLRGRAVDGIHAVLGLDTVQLWFDAKRHLLAAVSYTDEDPVRGPIEVLTEYANWTRVNRVMLPYTSHRSENGVLTQVTTATKLEPNPPDTGSLFVIPERYRLRSLPNIVSVVELSPGVFRLQHFTHTSMVVAQGDSLVLLDAPLNDAFMRVVLDSLRSRFPDKRARSFVVTHHHWDHTGGVRAAFAAGLQAIVHEDNADFVRSVGGPRTTPAKARRITTLRDSLAVGTGDARFTLYHIPTGHARGLVMAYFPATQLMFEVDLAAGPPNDRQDLYDFIVTRGIQVTTLARMHGPVMEWDAFVKTVPMTR